jgi:hypothetical protein
MNELGADVNQATHNGATPLFAAAKNGYLNDVQCLVIEIGADVNQTTLSGATPLHIAAENGRLDVAGGSAAVCARRRATAGWHVGSRTGVCIGRAAGRRSTQGARGAEGQCELLPRVLLLVGRWLDPDSGMCQCACQ